MKFKIIIISICLNLIFQHHLLIIQVFKYLLILQFFQNIAKFYLIQRLLIIN